MADVTYNPLVEETDATEEVVTLVVSTVEGWYRDGKIDWDDVWDRVDGAELDDGSVLDIQQLTSPAMEKIKKEVRALRRQG